MESPFTIGGIRTLIKCGMRSACIDVIDMVSAAAARFDDDAVRGRSAILAFDGLKRSFDRVVVWFWRRLSMAVRKLWCSELL